MRSIRPDKRFSFAAKFNILTITLILATSAGICLFIIQMEMKNHYNDLLSHGKTIADTTAKNCEFGIYTENKTVLLTVLESLSADPEIAYASVMNRQRRTLVSRVFKGTGELLKQDVLINEGSAEVRHQNLVDKQDGRHYIEILSPLMSGSPLELSDAVFNADTAQREPTILGYVRIGLTQEHLQKRVQRFILSAVLFTSFLVLVGMGLTVLMSRRITYPLKQLMKATQDISKGMFDIPVSIRTTDEIADLAVSFDHMRKSLFAYQAHVEERIAREQRHLLEKEKLMMDLHDGIGGITTNIGILSELAQKTADIENIKKTLLTISRLSREGISEIRSFMQSLDSKELSWSAFAAEIKKQGATLVEPHQIHFIAQTSLDEISEQPGSLLWVNVFRIYKEALTNVIKHSQAGAVTVALRVSGNGLRLSVQDDGIGCGKDINTGRGLPNMKKRAREIGGHVTMSPTGRGTQVRLEVPFPVNYTLPDEEL